MQLYKLLGADCALQTELGDIFNMLFYLPGSDTMHLPTDSTNMTTAVTESKYTVFFKIYYECTDLALNAVADKYSDIITL